MRICLLGDFSEHLDEGYKNTSNYLARGLEEKHLVFRLDVKRNRHSSLYRDLSRFQPEILHAIARPTSQSLLFLSFLQRLCPSSRSVVSALKPERLFLAGRTSRWHKWLFKLARPGLVLTQSRRAAALFASLGCRVSHLPNGVDLDRFRPVSPGRKEQLRQKYGLEPDAPIALHVGHLEAARNLQALATMPAAGIQVLVAGSVYMGGNPALVERLRAARIRVFEGYQPHVEELYQLSDLYVFPLEPGNSLAMPLSVLEAMACNLPVLATPFSGLVDAFQPGSGFKFIHHLDALLSEVQAMVASPIPPATREMVRAYSWDVVVCELQNHYRELLAG